MLYSESLHAFLSAVQTFGSVNTNQISTCRTGPTAILLVDKMPDTPFLYLYQVFYHAHAIFFTISLIQVFQALTGKAWAGTITVFSLSFCTESQGTHLAAPGVGC